MKLTVYADVLLAVNFLINYILLKISAFLGKFPYKTVNIILSSMVGAVFSLSILFDINPALSYGLKLLSVVVCAFLAFGFSSVKYRLKTVHYLMITTFVFTGVVLLFSESNFVYFNNGFCYINLNPLLLVLSVAFVYFILQISELLYSHSSLKEKKECEICINGRCFSTVAFYDSGFRVKDILGHRAVVLCSLCKIKNTLDAGLVSVVEDFLAGNMESAENIIHIFYSDISGSGILPAVKAEKIVIRKKEIKNAVVAFTAKSFTGDTEVIFGKDISDIIGG